MRAWFISGQSKFKTALLGKAVMVVGIDMPCDTLFISVCGRAERAAVV